MINSIRWLQESEDVRQKFIEKFGLKKSGGRAVENNKLVSDGISGEELYTRLSVKALQEFTGVKIADVYELFSIAVEIIKNEDLSNHEESISEASSHSARPAANGNEGGAGTSAKRRGRPKKQS